MKKIIVLFVPPILLKILKKIFFKPAAVANVGMWSGNYATWEEAKSLCTGYESEVILEKCKNASLKVKNSEAVYERDSVLFDTIYYSWGLLAGLQKAAIENGNILCVIDFGGSLGSSYYQNRSFLGGLKNIQWLIVEQKHFVDCGLKFFQDEKLKFYHTVEECFINNKPNVLILSGVLQNLENPLEWIKKFNNCKVDYILIDRSPEVNGDNILTIQNVSETIYSASYPHWFFNSTFLVKNLSNFKLISSFQALYEPVNYILNQKIVANWKGFIFKHN